MPAAAMAGADHDREPCRFTASPNHGVRVGGQVLAVDAHSFFTTMLLGNLVGVAHKIAGQVAEVRMRRGASAGGRGASCAGAPPSAHAFLPDTARRS